MDKPVVDLEHVKELVRSKAADTEDAKKGKPMVDARQLIGGGGDAALLRRVNTDLAGDFDGGIGALRAIQRRHDD